MRNELLYTVGGGAPEGGIHFIASKDFTNVDFFQNITREDTNYNFSNLEVYINGELTNQVANSISANTDDDVIIKATDDHYPWFGRYTSYSSRYNIDYIKSIEEPLPLMHLANGTPITSFARCFYMNNSLTSIPTGLFDNNPQVTSFNHCFMYCSNLTNIPEGLFDKNTQVTDFDYCFDYCSGLTSIPEGLFNNNPQVTSFNDCFAYCFNLTSIPEGLFDKNTEVISFNDCFNRCNSLTVKVQIGSIASSVAVVDFAYRTKEKGTVYCRAGSAAYTAFSEYTNANVNVLTY